MDNVFKYTPLGYLVSLLACLFLYFMIITIAHKIEKHKIQKMKIKQLDYIKKQHELREQSERRWEERNHGKR